MLHICIISPGPLESTKAIFTTPLCIVCTSIAVNIVWLAIVHPTKTSTVDGYMI